MEIQRQDGMLIFAFAIVFGLFAAVSYLFGRLLKGRNKVWLYVVEVYGETCEFAVVSACDPRLRKNSRGFYINSSLMVGGSWRNNGIYRLEKGSIERLIGHTPEVDSLGVSVPLGALDKVDKTRVMDVNYPYWRV